MPTHAAHALEFEVLVQRAARRGWLDLHDLADCYAALYAGGSQVHPHLDNPRKVDATAMAHALRALPPEWQAAARLLVVPSLHAYPHAATLPAGGLPAGVLGDGTLLVEASLGHTSLMHLAVQLGALHHELEKAHALVPPELRVPEGDEAPEALEWDDDRWVHLAFALGTDPAALKQAHQDTGGALLPLLLGVLSLPPIDIHADLDPGATTQRQRALADRVVATVAEMGLLSRPVHLWIGDAVVSDCLSPYPRELRQLLHRWALARPHQLGEDLQPLPEPLGEDGIYAVTADFTATDPELEQERWRAERSVGILRYRWDDFAFEAIDLGRIDPTVVDARLPGWDLDGRGPVLLRIPALTTDPQAGLLRGLLEALGPNLRGITLVLEGSVLGAPPGSLVLPHLLVGWAGERKLSLPTATQLDLEQLHGYADTTTRQGAILSLPAASLISVGRVAELQRELNVCAVCVGADALVEALSDALWRGTIAADVPLSWGLVSMQRTRGGRPTVPTLAGLSAVAIAALRELGAPPPTEHAAPPPEPAPLPESPPARPALSRRAIRIKA